MTSRYGPTLRRLGVLALALVMSGDASSAVADTSVRWLGVAGFTFTSGDTTIAADPFLSRPSLARTLLRRYVPDEAVLARFLGPGSPTPELARASRYLIGHSHYDHLGDVPWLASRTRGRVVGSATTAAIAIGYGQAPDMVDVAAPGATLDEGPFTVRVFASRHSEALLGRVPFEGTLREPPATPIHAFSFVLGDARGYLVTERASGLRIVLLSSAGYDAGALAALGSATAPIDLLLPAVRSRDAHYAGALVRTLRPRLVVPHHFDSFFTPVRDPKAADPVDEEDLAAFETELHDAARAEGIAVEVRRPKLFEAFTLRTR